MYLQNLRIDIWFKLDAYRSKKAKVFLICLYLDLSLVLLHYSSAYFELILGNVGEDKFASNRFYQYIVPVKEGSCWRAIKELQLYIIL